MKPQILLVTFGTPIAIQLGERMRDIRVARASIDETSYLEDSVTIRASWILMVSAGHGPHAVDVEISIVVPVRNIAGAVLVDSSATKRG